MDLGRRLSNGIEGELDPTRVVPVLVTTSRISEDDGGSNVLVGSDGGLYKVVAYADTPDKLHPDHCRKTSAVQTYIEGRLRKLHIEQ